MEAKIKLHFDRGYPEDDEKSSRFLEAIRNFCMSENLRELTMGEGQDSYECLIKEDNEIEELQARRNKLNRKISTLKKAKPKQK